MNKKSVLSAAKEKTANKGSDMKYAVKTINPQGEEIDRTRAWNNEIMAERMRESLVTIESQKPSPRNTFKIVKVGGEDE